MKTEREICGCEPDVAGQRFVLREEVVIEDFGDRSLVLLLDSLQLREINASARHLLAQLDGVRTVSDIAEALAAEHGTTPDTSLSSVAEALLDKERQHVVRRLVTLTTQRKETMTDPRYLANPEVSFRQEGDDGGILFNADSDALEVINPTAVEIWKALAAPATEADVVDRLCTSFEDAPREDVAVDVHDFIASMVEKGFIGIIEEEA